MNGSFDLSNKTSGISVVVRDHDGEVVGGPWRRRVSNVLSSDIAEALAARAAFELAIEFSFSPLVIESDCLKVVNASLMRMMVRVLAVFRKR